MSDTAAEAGAEFASLVAIMERLRGEDGCAWDRKQTYDSLRAYLLEETYEVLEAIDDRDWPELAGELGDLLLQPVFLARLASEDGHFTIARCLREINQKLVRRHPHIFAGTTADTAEEVKARWEEIKHQERVEKGLAVKQTSILDPISPAMPALAEASKIVQKAGSVGFEWPNVGGVIEKVREEAAELAQARATLTPAEVEHELGDLLFTLATLARYLKVNPEQALRGANRRFRARFAYIERELSANGETLEAASLERMDQLWNQAKQQTGLPR